MVPVVGFWQDVATTEGSDVYRSAHGVERATPTEVVKKLKGSSQKVRRAQILLKLRERQVTRAQAGTPGVTL
jgi:hypothetical protein